jgi:hypothetical protein
MSFFEFISQRKPQWSNQIPLWLGLFLCAAIPRVLAAFQLPNEEGDPYAYAQAIEMMRVSISAGTFNLSELFGFWLPLYQFVCALIAVISGQPILVGKLVSALCGTGVCLLVFSIAFRLTANLILSLLTFVVIAFNPVHIMYSAFSMSDVPHGFVVMSSLFFAMRNRWVVAASFAAVGGLMRPESWLFIVLLPALQFLLHRRISMLAFLIVLSAPLLWIYISWLATGNALEYFNVRGDYIRELLAKDPSLGSFAPSHVIANLQTMVYSTGHAVLTGCLVGGWLTVRRMMSRREQGSFEWATSLLPVLAYFFSALGFLLVAYFTKNQPAIFARYCLVLFALGLPVLAWTLLEARKLKPAVSHGFSLLVVILCLWQWAVQIRDGASFVNVVSQKRIVADYLRGHLIGSSAPKVFCDDDTIKTLAGRSADLFVGSSNSPGDSKLFLEYLRANRVEYLVYELRDRSAARKAFLDLGEDEVNNHFQLVASTSTDLRVYRTIF